MSVELTVVVGLVCSLLGAVLSSANAKRNFRTDVAQEAASRASVLAELKSISVGMTEVKVELRSVREDMREDHDRLIKLESSEKSQWARIEALENRVKAN